MSRRNCLALTEFNGYTMPRIFYATSAWVIAKKSRAASLGVLLLASLLTFGGYVSQFLLQESSRITFSTVVILAVVSILWWFTMIVIWFDPRKRLSRPRFADWSQALLLDLFLIFNVAVLSIFVRGL